MTFLHYGDPVRRESRFGNSLGALMRRAGGCGRAAAPRLRRVGNGCVGRRNPLPMTTHLTSPNPSATCLNTLMI
jgi:hypothetical protein